MEKVKEPMVSDAAEVVGRFVLSHRGGGLETVKIFPRGN
jgi:hypothetical protein